MVTSTFHQLVFSQNSRSISNWCGSTLLHLQPNHSVSTWLDIDDDGCTTAYTNKIRLSKGVNNLRSFNLLWGITTWIRDSTLLIVLGKMVGLLILIGEKWWFYILYKILQLSLNISKNSILIICKPMQKWRQIETIPQQLFQTFKKSLPESSMLVCQNRKRRKGCDHHTILQKWLDTLLRCEQRRQTLLLYDSSMQEIHLILQFRFVGYNNEVHTPSLRLAKALIFSQAKRNSSLENDYCWPIQRFHLLVDMQNMVDIRFEVCKLVLSATSWSIRNKIDLKPLQIIQPYLQDKWKLWWMVESAYFLHNVFNFVL